MPKAYVDLPAGQIHYRIEGSGPPVLLLHHTARSVSMFDPIIDDLARRRTVVAWDAPGHGESFRPVAEPSVDDYAAWAAEFMTALGFDDFGVFGCMTGAAFAIELAVSEPGRVKRLGLMSVPFFATPEQHAAALAAINRGRRVGDDGAEMLGQWRMVIDSWDREALLRPDLPDRAQALPWAEQYVGDLLRSGEYWEWGGRAAYTYDSGARFPTITQPTLVIGFAAESDPSVSLVHHLRHDAHVAQQIPGCRYVELPGAYGIIAPVASRERLLAALDEFFQADDAVAV